MTAPTDALLPCPFCGHDESLYVEHVEGTVLHPSYYVRCDYCGAQTGGTDKGHVEQWNTRATPTGSASGEDAKDAARYRWLRMQDWFSGSLCVLRDPKKVLTSGAALGADCPSRERLDDAIDAAIQGSANGQG